MRTFDIASLNVLIPTYDRILAQMHNTRFKDMTLEERCKMFEDSYASTFYETGSILSWAFFVHPILRNCRDAHLFMIFSLDDVVSICETGDLNRLIKLLDTSVAHVTFEEFREMADNDPAVKNMKKSSDGQDVTAYFALHILLTDNYDVKKITGVVRRDTFYLSDMTSADYVRVLKKMEPGEHSIAKIRETTWGLLRNCTACQKRGISLPKCSCKAVYYCNAECQRADWPKHRETCMKK